MAQAEEGTITDWWSPYLGFPAEHVPGASGEMDRENSELHEAIQGMTESVGGIGGGPPSVAQKAGRGGEGPSSIQSPGEELEKAHFHHSVDMAQPPDAKEAPPQHVRYPYGDRNLDRDRLNMLLGRLGSGLQWLVRQAMQSNVPATTTSNYPGFVPKANDLAQQWLANGER